MDVMGKKTIEMVREFLVVILCAFLFTTFLVSHNRIPSPSMVDTINVGDHILTTRLPYYARNPQRGEIVVFKQGNESWIKRVIGLPGETIDIQDGNMYIDGELLDENHYLGSEGISDLVTQSDITFPLEIPQNHYFLMGDNRPESKDSRYIGPIPRERIYAKAWVKIYPFDAIGTIQ